MSGYTLYFTDLANVGAGTNRFQWIQFDATVSEAEDLLFTDYFYWEHSSTGSENIAAEEYHIPAHVQTHIDCKCLQQRSPPLQGEEVVEVFYN